MKISVTKAVHVQNLILEIQFSDNTKQIIDFEPWLKLNPHPQHNKYLIEKNFKQFIINKGLLFWGENADLEFHTMAYYKGNLNEHE